MKILLIGYGKMGKEIEKVALERGHELVAIVDSNEDWDEESENIHQAEVAIEFTDPEAVVPNILRCFDHQLPVIVGTTGWYHQLDEIKTYCIDNKHCMMYSPNYSIGVNMFFKLNRELAQLMNNFDEYDVSLEETHHIYKQDSPSGTALKLVNDLISIIQRKDKWLKSPINSPDQIEVRSFREGNVPGVHIVTYESSCDTIEIKHSAVNRKGFALGAVKSAEWIIGKRGVFEIKDMLAF